VNKVLRVDQSPLGNSPSSNPATYTGVFEHVRQLFAKLPDAKLRGLHAGHFSFNIAGGRCEKCEGNGQIRIQMHFLPDVWIECDACRGSRYSEEVLAVKYRGKSISDFLTMSIGEARDLTSELPKIHGMLKTLCDVGLDYLALGQSAPTLSGGEAQRVKLAAELCRPATGDTLYLLDEPTTGLHFEDIRKLMMVLNALVASGNTVVVIEHNLDVIKCADWIIDMGPEAGKDGGQVVFAGTPESLVRYASEVIYQPPTKKRSTKKRSTKKRSDNMQVAEQGTASPKLRSYTGEALKSVLPTS
jgi:excinuclease ABC subunit A